MRKSYFARLFSGGGNTPSGTASLTGYPPASFHSQNFTLFSSIAKSIKAVTCRGIVIGRGENVKRRKED